MKRQHHKGRAVTVSFFSSLRVRLILLVLLAIVPALVIIFFDAAELREREVTKAKTAALTLSRLTARQYEEVIEAARQTLISLAQLPEIQAMDAVGCKDHLTELLAEYQGYHHFTVVDMTGDLFCSTSLLSEPPNVADQAWFRRTVDTGRFTGTIVVHDPEPNRGPGILLRGSDRTG